LPELAYHKSLPANKKGLESGLKEKEFNPREHRAHGEKRKKFIFFFSLSDLLPSVFSVVFSLLSSPCPRDESMAKTDSRSTPALFTDKLQVNGRTKNVHISFGKTSRNTEIIINYG
jgi:hypothetical protein